MHNRGKYVILVMLAIAVTLTSLAFWYNFERSRRAIALWGSQHADTINRAVDAVAAKWSEPRSEIAAGDFAAAQQRDIRNARGLNNVLRGLVEDVSFGWDRQPADQCVPQWQYALRLTEAPQKEDLDSAIHLLYAPNCRTIRLMETGATGSLRPEFAKILDEFFAEQFAPAN